MCRADIRCLGRAVLATCFVLTSLASSFGNEVLAFDIPEKWDHAVVAIGSKKYRLNEITGKVETERTLYGAGVLTRTDRYVLVTARHVVFDLGGTGGVFPGLYFWGNRIDGTEFERSFEEMTKRWPNLGWVGHPNEQIDIAASVVGLDLKGDRIAFVDLSDFQSAEGVKKGRDIYYLGYPKGLGSYRGSDPMVRKGIVALRETGASYFYIDATVAPGNSGGPVFVLEGDAPRFIGIVAEFVPFSRGGQYFHAGLGKVYPTDFIRSLIFSDEFKSTY